MSLRALTNREIIKIGPEETISDAAHVLRHFKIGSVFVAENEEYIGIMTESDLVRKVVTKGFPPETAVSQVMCTPLIQIDIEKSVIEANHLMRFNEIRHLGISENGKVVGLISVRDIVHFFSNEPNGPVSAIGEVFKPLEVLTHRDIQTIDPSASVKEAAKKMTEYKIGSLLVAEEGAYIGIVTESDIVQKVIGYDLSPSLITVGVVMNTPIIDVNIVSSVQTAIDLMSRKRIRHLAVIEEGNIVGILSIRDLIGLISVRDLPRFFSNQRKF
ncbi:CBS domain-containing protein [Nitrospira defluvii]|nr:CBS domain-containing protein [Nitrospira defluvii]